MGQSLNILNVSRRGRFVKVVAVAVIVVTVDVIVVVIVVIVFVLVVVVVVVVVLSAFFKVVAITNPEASDAPYDMT